MPTPLHPSRSGSRRRFLQQTAVAAAIAGFPAILRAARPNSNVQLAAVGVDGMGHNDLQSLRTHPKVKYVAFCDIDTERFAKADAAVPGVPHFQDFRVMLERLGDTIDAVNVATPDHSHALMAIEAMRRGKHVYVQKPLTHTVWEARQLRLWAAKKGVVTQMGNQPHSKLEYRLAARLIRDGAIGKVKEVHSWVGVTGNQHTRLLEPPPSGPVPASLDWNGWIGGAPMREYAPNAYHPFVWRDWQAFGSGALGDFGCHIIDPVFMALGLKAPVSVAADHSGINRHVWPTTEIVRWIFPGNERTAGSTLNLTWTDGGVRPSRKLAKLPDDLDLPTRGGSLFIGELGNLVLPHVAAPRLYPLEKFENVSYPKDVAGLDHWHTWIDAILAGSRTTDGFDHAGPLTETVQLGNVATRVARRPVKPNTSPTIDPKEATVLTWDAEHCRIANHKQANALLTKTYREGWQVPPAPAAKTS